MKFSLKKKKKAECLQWEFWRGRKEWKKEKLKHRQGHQRCKCWRAGVWRQTVHVTCGLSGLKELPAGRWHSWPWPTTNQGWWVLGDVSRRGTGCLSHPSDYYNLFLKSGRLDHSQWTLRQSKLTHQNHNRTLPGWSQIICLSFIENYQGCFTWVSVCGIPAMT